MKNFLVWQKNQGSIFDFNLLPLQNCFITCSNHFLPFIPVLMNWFYHFEFMTNFHISYCQQGFVERHQGHPPDGWERGWANLVSGGTRTVLPTDGRWSTPHSETKKDRFEVTVFRALIIIDEADSLWPISQSSSLILMIIQGLLLIWLIISSTVC